ncbi:toxin VasX [Paracoccus onubensis]|uniref:Toxin VasX N-terminal region domain-containing protein n=1 Tax=Paracoccus onubensis TaxID=1675788 RepID=A0A418SUJ3_9RHOB|nr:toxin VasX [Paracoccus onubensis]RJE84569.1 hypothetical protein D3P04_13050 [Paracoccus onubensis]
MSEHGNFSANADAEADAWHCTPGLIPIFPVRFSQQPFDLGNVVPPSSISNPGSSIIRTLRQGYVYIFIESPEDREDATARDGRWYVFRHSTASEDVNSDVAPEGTDTRNAGQFMFSKYEWTDNYGRGDWTYSGERHPYCWVPRWASTIWIAYSEYRWPPAFFEKGHGQAFRSQIMQKIDLRGQNQWAAYIGEAPELVEEFKPESARNMVVKARLNLSQTGFEPRQNFPISQNAQSEQCVAMAALFDPMGDIAELRYRLELLNDHQTRFSSENTYPLTIGAFCEQLETVLPKRDGLLNVFNKFALREGWQASYLGLRSILDALVIQTRDTVRAAQNMIGNEADHQLGKHLALASQEAEAGDLDALEYYSVLLGRAVETLCFTAQGSGAIREGLGGDVGTAGQSLRAWLGKFRSLWNGVSKRPFELYKQKQYSFQIVFEAIGVELAQELSAGTQSIESWEAALDAGYKRNGSEALRFSRRSMNLEDAVKFVTGNLDQTSYRASSVSGALDHGGNVLATRRVIDAGQTADIPFIETNTTASFVGGIDAHRRIAMADMTSAGFGLFLATWALVETTKASAKAQTPELIERGMFTSFAARNDFKLGVAAVGMAEALNSTYTKFRATRHTVSQISSEALSTLYEGVANRNALVDIAKPTQGAIGRAVGYWLPRVSVAVGSVVAVAGITRGYERQDNNEIVGNIAMLIGGLLLFPGLGWVAALVGGVLLFIGFLFTLGTYTPMEDVVRLSFWGWAVPYWEEPQRSDLDVQIMRSRGLPGQIKDYFTEEVARFAEFGWAPEIVNLESGDGSFLVRSEAITEMGADAISIKVEQEMSGPQFSTYWRDLRTAKTAIPGANTIRITLTDQIATAKPIRVTATVTGKRTGMELKTVEMLENP